MMTTQDFNKKKKKKKNGEDPFTIRFSKNIYIYYKEQT